MKLIIKKIHTLGGRVTPPGSKSQSIRALLLATLARGESVLFNVLDSDDTAVAKQVCQSLGANLVVSGEKIEVRSMGAPLLTEADEINTGDSGITTRFVLPVLGLRAGGGKPIILDCGKQMRRRPLASLVAALNNLGMEIKFLNNDSRCPLLVSGTLSGGKTRVEGLTSQFVSALLLSLPCAEKDSEITVKDLHERPYMEMTLEWLRGQGIEFGHYQKRDFDAFVIKGKQSYRSFTKQIPADFSSLSYPLAAAALIPGEVKLRGIDMNDRQGDKRLIAILQAMGADIQINDSELLIKGGKKLTGLKIDANDIPDLVPTLAVVGARAEGETEIINVKQARFKETDRIHSMATELKKMGAKIEELPDGLIVNQSDLTGAEVRGYNDHRTIMALAVAGLVASGETAVDTAKGINKTFPNFVDLMNDLGAKIKVIK